MNIITKRGRMGAPVAVLTVKRGANWLPNPETLWPSTYYRNAAGQIVEFNALRSDRVTGEYPGDTIVYGPWFRTGSTARRRSVGHGWQRGAALLLRGRLRSR